MAAPGPVALLAATAPKSQSSSAFLYILLLVGVAFYFFIYRPQQRKQRAAREASNRFEVGDEVVTAGGMVGRVLAIEGDRVTLETSVGASFVVLRPYVVRRLEPAVPEVDDDDVAEADGEEHDADGATHPTDGSDDHPPDGTDEPDGRAGGGSAPGPDGSPTT